MVRLPLVLLIALTGCGGLQDGYSPPYDPPAYDSAQANDTDAPGEPPTPQRVCEPLDTAFQVARAWPEEEAFDPIDSLRLGFTPLDPALDGPW